jgi:hypothetical protein
LKLEILTCLANEANISIILREFQVWIEEDTFWLVNSLLNMYHIYSFPKTGVCAQRGQGLCGCDHSRDWPMR